MEPFGVFFIFILIAIVIRLVAGSFDGDRVEAYIQKNGWKLVDRSWDPFGPGWFGEKDSRIYQVVFEDQNGDLHKAHVKTSMLSGVYLTNDQIVQRSDRNDPIVQDALKSENERLKERIRELEQNSRV